MPTNVESPWLTGTEVVLVVEDERRIRALIGNELKRLGYQVLEAENGEHALAVLAQHDGLAHALVTDMVMPKVPGGPLIAMLRELYPKLAVVVVSAFSEDLLGATGAQLPGVRYLPKPFTSDALARTLREALDA